MFEWAARQVIQIEVEDRIMTLALTVARVVETSGARKILEVESILDESEDWWPEFFRMLKNRGLGRVCPRVRPKVPLLGIYAVILAATRSMIIL